MEACEGPNAEVRQKLDETLYTAAEAVRSFAALVAPVIPHSAEKIWQQLGFTQPVSEIQIEI